MIQEFEFGLTTLFVMHSPDFVNRTKDPGRSIHFATVGAPDADRRLNAARRGSIQPKEAGWRQSAGNCQVAHVQHIAFFP